MDDPNDPCPRHQHAGGAVKLKDCPAYAIWHEYFFSGCKADDPTRWLALAADEACDADIEIILSIECCLVALCRLCNGG